MFEAFAAGDRFAINPNIRNGVYAVELKQKHGTKGYDSLLSFARETKTADEYQDAIKGLGNTRDPAIMQSLLKLMLTDELKPQDVRSPAESIFLADVL
jgi:hypothetical protein